MLKYLPNETQVTFSEIPEEVSLCINITNCPIHCPDCHSKHLWEDIGEPLTEAALKDLIESNSGISCVCFMGGDNDTMSINILAAFVRKTYPKLKIAWYSGRPYYPMYFTKENFDYLKLGPYIKERGGLNSPTTNQKLLKFAWDKTKTNLGFVNVEDITYKFHENITKTKDKN